MYAFDFEPVESRAGLVVLNCKRSGGWLTNVQLCVGNPVTGEYAFLPPATVLRNTTRDDVLHVVLGRDEDDGARRSFRLLVLGEEHRAQTFSSRTGKWGPVTQPFAQLDLPTEGFMIARSSAAVELRGVAHWLYEYNDFSAPSFKGYGVLATNIAGIGPPATAIKIPQHCLRMRRCQVTEELLLARSAEGRLALVVAEYFGIVMWTLSDDSTSWERRLVVDRKRILGSAELLCSPLCCNRVKLEWFGQASGTVAFQMNGVGILLLNLETREIT